MAVVLLPLAPSTAYDDRKAMLAAASPEAYKLARDRQFSESTTVYVGNISFYTTEEQIERFFESCGPIADVAMGLNRTTRQPCGFCFVEFVDQASAFAAVNDLDRCLLDDHVIKVSWDVGGDVRAAGRTWGRGFFGGQPRDELRQDFDPARGGFGRRRGVEEGVDQILAASQLRTYFWVPTPRLAGGVRQARPHQAVQGSSNGGVLPSPAASHTTGTSTQGSFVGSKRQRN